MPNEFVANKQAGQSTVAYCQTCNGKKNHIILCDVAEHYKEDNERFSFYADTTYQTIQCKGCDNISFRKISTDSTMEEYEDPVEKIYPPPENIRSSLHEHHGYLDKKVHDIYMETLSALNNNQPILAGIGIRAIIETVCKHQQATGKNLELKINALVEQHVLTPAGAIVLHRLRVLGNTAAHEAIPHPLNQLRIAMEIVEHTLKSVYIIPALAENGLKSS